MRSVLITGGCGFIGTNLAFDRLERGDAVIVLDNCARAGTERNREALLANRAGRELLVVAGDVRDAELVAQLASNVDVVFHLAAQVAVTSSVADPRTDFEVNALGTLNILEAARLSPSSPTVLYASTNKVYGALDDVPFERRGRRYVLPSLPHGVNERHPLDFHSPYGCSKGAADQYVLDYARIYGLRTVVFRQSCVYGPWQYGNEDQGWIAHFALQAMRCGEITLYGDGLQVRDVLFVGDLLEAYDAALGSLAVAAGRVYNIGGGPSHATSLLEFMDVISSLVGRTASVGFGDWRPGDQRVYISDVRRAAAELDWAPSTDLDEGLRKLQSWIISTLEGTVVA